MKPFRQMLRQPLKTVAGILLIAFAVAALCICVGQMAAATQTAKSLNETFRTLALPAENYPKEADGWATEWAKAHPETVQTVSQPRLASAYIPQLLPDNYTSQWSASGPYSSYQPEPNGARYDTAVFQITLTYIGNVLTDQKKAVVNGEWVTVDAPGEIHVELFGTIENVLSLAEGYPDPNTYTIRMDLPLSAQEALEKLNLQKGNRYLVHGSGYYDLDWNLRCSLGRIMTWREDAQLPEWRLDTLEVLLTEEEALERQQKYYENWGAYQSMDRYLFYKCRIADLYHGVNGREVRAFRSVALTLGDPSTVPTIYPLTGDAQAFLNSPEGANWLRAVESQKINSQAFPTVGIQNPYDLTEFVYGSAQLTQGRQFSAQEIAQGSPVCMISETVAEKNGLALGDTISLSFYEYSDLVPAQTTITQEVGTLNHTAYRYYDGLTPLLPQEEFTIVGIYKKTVPWEDPDNLYHFTVNTVFLPENAIPVEGQTGYYGFFRGFVLENSQLKTFQLATMDAGFEDAFVYFDSGYSRLAPSLNNYNRIADRAVLIGGILYVVILGLFLLLYPGSFGKTAAHMHALGVGKFRLSLFIAKSQLLILLPGTLLGCGLCIGVWNTVLEQLLQASSVHLAIERPTAFILWAGAAQLGLALLGTFLVGLLISARTSLMKQK